jgi:hypothetical protein
MDSVAVAEKELHWTGIGILSIPIGESGRWTDMIVSTETENVQ